MKRQSSRLQLAQCSMTGLPSSTIQIVNIAIKYAALGMLVAVSETDVV
jgi:hypothetical protein